MVLRLSILAGAAAFAVAACAPDRAEEAGEGLDSAIEETTQGERNLTDGPIENAGEAVDQAGENVKEGVEDAGNAIERRTDGE